MGDLTSAEEKKEFSDKLQYFERIQNSSFGPVDIFRLQEPPYEYLMYFQKKFIPGDPRLAKYKECLKLVLEKDHKNCSKIHFISEKEEVNMCIKDKRIGVFCNYYNFTLRNAIDKKKYKQSKFSESQLAYVMMCLFDVGLYLKKFGISFGDYRSQKIFLSPQGYLKLYLLQLEQNNKHSAFYQALSCPSDINHLILSPEQLINIANMKDQLDKNDFKADVFRIGMVLVEMLTLDQIRFYYNQEKTAYKMGRISYELSSLNLEYSSQFLSIIRKCLNEDPKNRINLEQGYSLIEQYRKKSANASYCIKINDDEDSSKKRKPLRSVKGQYILSGIQKRLTPAPIKSMIGSTSPRNQNKRPY